MYLDGTDEENFSDTCKRIARRALNDEATTPGAPGTRGAVERAETRERLDAARVVEQAFASIPEGVRRRGAVHAAVVVAVRSWLARTNSGMNTHSPPPAYRLMMPSRTLR